MLIDWVAKHLTQLAREGKNIGIRRKWDQDKNSQMGRGRGHVENIDQNGQVDKTRSKRKEFKY